MRRILIALTVLLVVGMTATAAMALTNFDCAPQGAHFATGSGEPVCTLDQTTDTVSCTGTELAGVGHTNATETLTIKATATVLCHNPGNDSIVEPHTTTATGNTSAGLTPSKNGRLTVDPIIDAITTTDVAQQFTCPNRKWREEVTDITITSFTYTVRFDGFSCDVITLTGP